MINTQHSGASPSCPAALVLASGQVLALGAGGGDISVISGRVWLTSSGDLDDYFLDAGEVLHVGSGGALVESWHRDAPATIAWQPTTLVRRLRERLAGVA